MRAKEAAKLANLKAKASILEKQRTLPNEMEKLALQEEIVVTQAREQALAQVHSELNPEVTSHGHGDGMNEYFEAIVLHAKVALPKAKHEPFEESCSSHQSKTPKHRRHSTWAFTHTAWQ